VCPHLRKLRCVNLDDGVTGAGFADIAANCPNLEYLEIIINGGLTDVGLRDLVEGAFSALMEVELYTRKIREKFTQAGMEQLVRSFKGIKSFGLYFEYSHEVDTSIVNICSQLETLSLYNCSLTDADLVGISVPFLHTLKLNGEHNSVIVTNAGLIAITTTHCNSLTSLDLEGFTGLTDESIRVLSERCSSLRHLRLVDIDGCITDEALVYISTNCRALESIVIDYWNEGHEVAFTSVGVAFLVRLAHDHNLTSVQISNYEGQYQYSNALCLAFPQSCTLL
jgi:hypothetical protein